MAASVGNQEGIKDYGFKKVPLEIISKIINYVDREDLFSVLQVNRQWKGVVLQNEKSTNRENFTHILKTLIKFLPDYCKPILQNVQENYEVEEPNSLVEPGRFSEAQKDYIKSQFPKNFANIYCIKDHDSLSDFEKIIIYNFLVDFINDGHDSININLFNLSNVYIKQKKYCAFNSSLNRLYKLDDNTGLKNILVENVIFKNFYENHSEGVMLLNSIRDDSIFYQSFEYIYRQLCENNNLKEVEFLLNNSEIRRIPFAKRVVLSTVLIKKQWYCQVAILVNDNMK